MHVAKKKTASSLESIHFTEVQHGLCSGLWTLHHRESPGNKKENCHAERDRVASAISRVSHCSYLFIVPFKNKQKHIDHIEIQIVTGQLQSQTSKIAGCSSFSLFQGGDSQQLLGGAEPMIRTWVIHHDREIWQPQYTMMSNNDKNSNKKDNINESWINNKTWINRNLS